MNRLQHDPPDRLVGQVRAPCCLDVTAGEAERGIASEVAAVLRSMDVDEDDESIPCSEALMTVVEV